MTIRSLPLTLPLLLLAGVPAQAQDPMPGDTLVAQIETAFGDGADYAAHELGAERVVQGAPYCADAVHETVRWLPDPSGGAANRIVQKQQSRLCRDGQGRTRQEIERQGRTLVYLRDPVAHENWLLDPAAKTASRLRGHGMAVVDEGAWREFGERMRAWSGEVARQWSPAGKGTPGAPVAPVAPTPPTPPLPPTPALVAKNDREIFVMRVDPGAAAVPPPVAWRALAYGPRGEGTVTPLGTKDVEGVRANGERTAWTIEAGKIGNEKPIVITREVWTSPDLALTVSTRDFDPRSGEVSYRLQNLRRGEPDPALMKVPADYRIRGGGAAPKASAPTG